MMCGIGNEIIMMSGVVIMKDHNYPHRVHIISYENTDAHIITSQKSVAARSK